MSTDSIADMFTCLRNTRKTTVIFPYSRFKSEICEKLKQIGCLAEH
jgi:ribosomal protein S8